jgi:hypothetical protein
MSSASPQSQEASEHVEMASKENEEPSTSTDDRDPITFREDKTTEPKSSKPDADTISSSEDADNKTTDKDKEDDIADGYDPFSQESFRPLMSANQYSMRKTASQALMDVALMMANISQLRTLLTAGESMEYSTLLIVMVALSLGCQVIFAILISIIWMRESEQHQKDEYLNTLREVTEANNGAVKMIKDKNRNSLLRRQQSFQGHVLTSHLNYISMVLVFTITVINMFITGFGIKLETPATTTPKTTTSQDGGIKLEA